MEIATSPSEQYLSDLYTPDVSVFVPSPANSTPSMDSAMQEKADTPSSYSGLRLERFVVHQGRLGPETDTSLLEAIVESAFDDFRSVRIAAEGSESVHSFVRALAEEFLNCGEAVHVNKILVSSPEDGSFICTVEAVYPAIPRFRHLAQRYVGNAVSDRSVFEASLSAACNAVGKILLTFQPEGFELPPRPVGIKEISPLPSTADSADPCDRGSSIFRPVFLGEAKHHTPSMFARLFSCGVRK